MRSGLLLQQPHPNHTLTLHLTANTTSEEHGTVTPGLRLLFLTDKLGNLTLIRGSVGTMASKLM